MFFVGGNGFTRELDIMYFPLVHELPSPSCLAHNLKYITKIQLQHHLGDNCIQKFHFGRYIVGYTVGNLVLRRRLFTKWAALSEWKSQRLSKQVAQWATIAHLGASIVFGKTIIYDAQWQVALTWNSDQEYIQTLTGYLQVLKRSELKLQRKPGEDIFFRCSKAANPVGSDGI